MAKKRASKKQADEMIVNGQEYEMVDVETIGVHPENPRKGDVELIRELIRQNRFYGALVCQKKTRLVLVGNHRFVAAVEEGLKRVPVIWIDVDDRTAKKIMVADNKASDVGVYDNVALVGLLSGFDEDFFGTGYTSHEFSTLSNKITSPDEFPSYGTDIETKTKCPKCGYEW